MNSLSVSGMVVDVVEKKMFPGTVVIKDGLIESITPTSELLANHFIIPGFIDAHVHIESSMMIPSEFAKLAVTHGTVATVSDPHEISNVLGSVGLRYMIENGKQVPFHFYFGASSCVPATSFETSGAKLGPEEIRTLFRDDGLKYLSEMMNYPGVINKDPDVLKKIQIAQEFGLPIDGHAPGLRGGESIKYFNSGITTDHECFTLEEALEKVKLGVKILIREGSAAKNYEALHPLIRSHPEQVMFCSDDKHPNELVKGHINQLVKRSIAYGYDTMDVLRAACYHPIIHYNLDVGYLQKGQSADFIVVDNLKDFNVKKTFIKGQIVSNFGKSLISTVPSTVINQFGITQKKVEDFAIVSESGDQLKVIEAYDGQLITGKLITTPKRVGNKLESDVERDILKLAVINRYNNAPVSIGFIKGFGLKNGALASCIAHDSHNIIAVGVRDLDICMAVNDLIKHQGGISVVTDGIVDTLPLPVGGIMSNRDCYTISNDYSRLDQKAKKLGTALQAPFMTLSFMALLVIPSLKLSDKGLFDGTSFSFVPLIM